MFPTTCTHDVSPVTHDITDIPHDMYPRRVVCHPRRVACHPRRVACHPRHVPKTCTQDMYLSSPRYTTPREVLYKPWIRELTVGNCYPRHVPTTCTQDMYPRHVPRTCTCHPRRMYPRYLSMCTHDMLNVPTTSNLHPRPESCFHNLPMDPSARTPLILRECISVCRTPCTHSIGSEGLSLLARRPANFGTNGGGLMNANLRRFARCVTVGAGLIGFCEGLGD